MDEKERKVVGFGPYVMTWLNLVMLTALTVTVAGMHLGALSVATALVIASAKSMYVLNVFMHLKQEKRFFKIVVMIVVCTIALFIGFTFLDVSFR
jgi:cytochrome c oxidase subunit 4